MFCMASEILRKENNSPILKKAAYIALPEIQRKILANLKSLFRFNEWENICIAQYVSE